MSENINDPHNQPLPAFEQFTPAYITRLYEMRDWLDTDEPSSGIGPAYYFRELTQAIESIVEAHEMGSALSAEARQVMADNAEAVTVITDLLRAVSHDRQVDEARRNSTTPPVGIVPSASSIDMHDIERVSDILSPSKYRGAGDDEAEPDVYFSEDHIYLLQRDLVDEADKSYHRDLYSA